MHALRAALAAFAILLATGPAGSARAQEEGSGTSYITPFPAGDTYKLQAYGDALADGLLGGLIESFSGDNRVDVSRKARTLGGILRPEFDDEMRNEESARDPVHVAVVMIGIWDRIIVRLPNGKRVPINSPEWKEEYGRRVDRLIKVLKRKGVAVYWVGLPIMRRGDINDDMQAINNIVREKVYLNGAKYIDIQAQFADDAGNFAPYGPDLAGKSRLLREMDGITFTQPGYRKLAHFVEQEMKRDLALARAERTIPLAGSESEQKRLSALKPRNTPEGDNGWRSTVVASAKDGKATPRASPVGAGTATTAAPDTTAEQKADNGRVILRTVGSSGREETITIDIVRPAIPAAVVALVTRKESSDRPSQMGDVVAEDVGGGVVVLSSISPTGTTPGAPGTPRRLAPSEMPYYAVLVKGDRRPPKPGRADDFSWPRVDPDYGFPAPSATATLPQRRPAVGARAPRS